MVIDRSDIDNVDTGAGATGPVGVVTHAAETDVLALHAEILSVSKNVHRTLVRATRTTGVRDELVETDLATDSVVVEHVAMDRIVDAVPPVRIEGDVTIVPVVKEIVVVERRLRLVEEVHIRRVRTTTRHSQTVSLRHQEVALTRTPIED